MRIGINASFLRKPGTGIGQVTVHFLRTLAQQKEQEGVSAEGTPITYCVYTEEPVQDFDLPSSFTARHFLPLWKRDDVLRKWLWERRLSREAQRDGCTHFLSLYQSTTIMPRDISHTMVVHDLIPRLFPLYQWNWRKRWYWRAVEHAIARAATLVAVSQSTKNDLVEGGADGAMITVAYPGVSPLFREALAPETENRIMAAYGLVPGYIYHGGGLEVRKNTEKLLRAYAVLQKKVPSESLPVLPPLVISGTIFAESNPLATPVRSLISELGLGEQVRLLDFVPEADLPALYKNALFFAYPSLYEGFGLPVLEALSMGTPVLLGDHSSLPEVAGDAALYIDPSDQASLVSGLERLLTDASLRQSLSSMARQEADRFTWSAFTQTVLCALSRSFTL